MNVQLGDFTTLSLSLSVISSFASSGHKRVKTFNLHMTCHLTEVFYSALRTVIWGI